MPATTFTPRTHEASVSAPLRLNPHLKVATRRGEVERGSLVPEHKSGVNTYIKTPISLYTPTWKDYFHPIAFVYQNNADA